MNDVMDNLFWWLVRQHIEVNLPEAMDTFDQGVIRDRYGKPLEEGKDHGMPYQGVLILANGDRLQSKLIEDNIVTEPPRNTYPVRTGGDLQLYLSIEGNDDGAHLYNGETQRMGRVIELSNQHASLPKTWTPYAHVPEDFMRTDRTGLYDMGLKTRLAIKVTQAYPFAHAMQVKRSAYGPLRAGLVTHFTSAGLAQDFMFDYRPDAKGPFIDSDNGIVGVHRTYQPGEHHVERVSSNLISLDDVIDLPELRAS